MARGRSGASRARAALGAGGCGALLALASLGLERLLSLGAPWSLDAAVVYATFGGGILAALVAALPASWRSPGLALGAGGLCLPLALFVGNVVLLAGQPWHSASSLAADLVLAVLVLGAAVWAGRRVERGLVDHAVLRGAAHGSSLAWLAAVVLFVSPHRQPPQLARGPRAATGPDLLLIAADSVRADRLGLYGHAGVAGATSPRLDALAPSARVFEQAYSASSWTGPSVRALIAPDWLPTDLPSTLRAAGYATACFSVNPNLSPGAALVAGFQVRAGPAWRFALGRSLLARALDALLPQDDAAIVRDAVRWWRAAEAPRFLYVHLMDSHMPYTRPPLDGRAVGSRWLAEAYTGAVLTAAEREEVVARYEAGVHSAIAAAVDLVEAVAPSRPLVILTADHGESLGEEGRWFHGKTLAPELLSVPLVVLGPQVRAGRVAEVVGADAVPATLLRAALGRCDGCPVPDLRDATPLGVAEGGLPPGLLYRVRDGHRVVLDTRTKKIQLFDLASDPRRDVAAARPEFARQLAAGLARRVDVPAPPAEALERLRALGYVDAGRPPPH